MTRRTFSFASLVLTSSAALANGVSPDTEGGGVRLASAANATPKGDELLVRLSVINTSDVPLDVLVQLGNRPGPDLRVFVVGDDGDDIELGEVSTGVDRRAVMSRMGPRPQYEALAIGGRLEFGRWTYALPKGADHEAFRVVAHVTVAQADRPIELVHVLRANGAKV